MPLIFHRRENEETQSLIPASKKATLYLIVSACMAAFGSSFQFGYNIGVINSGQNAMLNHDSLSIWIMIVCIYSLGGVIGSGIISVLMIRFIGSRRFILSLNNIFFLLGGFLMFLSANEVMLMIGRFVVGLGAGVGSVIAPIYLSEISTPKNRGMLCGFYYLGIALGLLFGSFLTMNMVLGSEKWRYCLIMTAAVGFIHMILFPFCAKSPRYCLVDGNKLECKEELSRLRGTAVIQNEFKELKDEVQRESGMGSLTYKDLFIKSKYLRRPLLIAVFLHMSVQFSGVFFIFVSSTSIFRHINIFHLNNHLEKIDLYTTIMNIVSVLMASLALFLVEKVGRKLMLIGGFLGMSLCYLLLGFAVHFAAESSLPFYLICLIIVFYSIGPGPIPWLLPVEIFPGIVRTKLLTIGVCVNWISMTLFIMASLILVGKAGHYLYFVVAAFCLIFAVTAWYFVPETKGKTAVEVQQIFGGLPGVYSRFNTGSYSSLDCSDFVSHSKRNSRLGSSGSISSMSHLPYHPLSSHYSVGEGIVVQSLLTTDTYGNLRTSRSYSLLSNE